METYLIHMTKDEFKHELKQTVTEILKENQTSQIIQESYLTRKEVAEKLRISLPTLHRATRKGFIKGYKISGRILFKLSEVEKALKEIENLKYRRE